MTERPPAGRTVPTARIGTRLALPDRIVLALLAALLAVTAVHHELGHDEAQAWNIARASAGFGELLWHSRFEGHTPPWYAVLWLAGHGGGPWTMQLVAIVLVLAVATLLLRDKPFGRPFCLAILAGYFVAYEYAIITRPYVLTLALAASLASLLHRKPQRDPLLPALLCALIAFVSAYSALLSLALLIAALGTIGAREASRARLALALALYAAALLASVWIIVAPLGSTGFERGMLGGENIGSRGLLEILRTPVLPHADRLPLGIGSWLSETLPGRTLTALATAAALVAVGTLLQRRRALLLGWIAAIGLIAGGALFSGLVSERHLGHLFIAALVLCWIAAPALSADRPAGAIGPAPRARRQRVAAAALSVTLLYHALIGAAAIAHDLRRSLTPWKRVADAIEREVDGPYVLLTDFSYTIGALLAYLDRPAYDVRCDCFTRHFEWVRVAPENRRKALADAWCALAATGRGRVLVVLQDGSLDDDARLLPLARVSVGYRDGERRPVRVWTPSPAALRACGGQGR